jgi:hypothetical protein
MGRRGLVLFLFGAAWVVQGLSFFLLEDMVAGQPAYFLIDRLPLAVQGSLWIISGAVSIGASLRPRRENDTLGFLAVSGMPILLVASFLVGTITYALLGSPVWVLGILGFFAWGPIILALAVIASWPELPVLPSGQEGVSE